MAYIKVDLAAFENAAEAVETYIDKQKSQLRIADGTMNVLATAWQGPDYTEAKQKWEQIDAPGSSAERMTTALQNYADFLRYAQKKYTDAQTKAVNRAFALPK